MTTLTDRYVWAVLRAVPEAQRAELEREIRALVADTIDARLAAGTPEADAERAALIELGDPERLAARYTDQNLYLIGPRLYLEWRRVLFMLLPIVPPIVGMVVLAADLLGGDTVGQAIVSGLGTGFMVALQMTFWITLVFAVLDRASEAIVDAEHTWTPDKLPDVPDAERMGLGEVVGAVITSVILAVLIVWQQLAPPIDVDGTSQPLLDPALWSFWLPYFLVVTVLEVILAVAVFLHGRWTMPFATVNAILGAAFAIPAIWLLETGQLLNPAVEAAVAEAGGTWLDTTLTISAIVIAIIVIWDAIDAFRKAYVNRKRSAPAVA
jgi:hypothetical protein